MGVERALDIVLPGRSWRSAGLPLRGAAAGDDEVGGWTTTQTETRYGCFLPDLTGLARDLSAASLPRHYIRSAGRLGKADRRGRRASLAPPPPLVPVSRRTMREPNFYAASGLDRAGHRRKDPAWLAQRLEDASSRFLPVWRSNNLIVTAAGGSPRGAFLARREIADALGETVLLGVIEECAYFAVDLSHVEAPLDLLTATEPVEFTDLRRVGPLLARREGSLLAYARGIAYWHSRHRFCGVCGSEIG